MKSDTEKEMRKGLRPTDFHHEIVMKKDGKEVRVNGNDQEKLENYSNSIDRGFKSYCNGVGGIGKGKKISCTTCKRKSPEVYRFRSKPGGSLMYCNDCY